MPNKKIYHLRQKLAQRPINTGCLLDIALEYEKLGNYYRAGKYLKKIIEIEPNNIPAMRQIQTNEMRLLVRKYGSFKSFHKWHEILARGRAGDPMVFDRLLEGLQNRHKWIRRECIYAIGEIGDERALEALVTIADQPDIAGYIEQALNKICKKKSPNYLLQKAREINKQVCINIITYFGFKKDLNAAEALIGIARDPNEDKWIRGSASWALGLIGDSKALSVLKTIIQSENEDYVREESEEAYHKIQTRLRQVQNLKNN